MCVITNRKINKVVVNNFHRKIGAEDMSNSSDAELHSPLVKKDLY